MLTVGITGGIGSGKTTISKIFNTMGIPVYNADISAKTLINTDTFIKEKLTDAYGENIYDKGNINRKLLAEIIFSDVAQRQYVNSIVHPRVKADFKRWVTEQTTPFVLHEAAILFEIGLDKIMDATILVTAPEQIRIQRVIDRDGLDRNNVEARIKAQMSEVDKMALSDYIITNDGVQPVMPQILTIYKALTSK